MSLKQAIAIVVEWAIFGHSADGHAGTLIKDTSDNYEAEYIEAVRICEIYIKPAADTKENWDM